MGKKSRLKKERKVEEAAFYRNLQIPKERVAGAFLDGDTRIILTNDILINQIRRDALEIAASFDSLCDSDLRVLSEFHAKSIGLLSCGIAKNAHDDFRLKLGLILNNAQASFVAALYLLRGGFLLQPGMVLRTLLEQVSTAIHLTLNPSDLTKIEKGSFDSPKTIASAKKVIPIYGQLYGAFSSSFTHVSKLHARIDPIKPFTDKHPALDANLMMLATSLFLLAIAIELAFFDHASQPLFWRRLGPGKYLFELSPKARALLDAIHIVDPK